MTEEQKQEVNENRAADDLISKANVAAARMEEANKKMEENIAKMEKMQVEKTFSGTADTHQQVQKEESPKEYAARVMANDVKESPDA